MKEIILRGFYLSLFACTGIPHTALAFYFDATDTTTVLVDAAAFPKNSGDITSPSSAGARLVASGDSSRESGHFGDRVKIDFIVFNTNLSSQGFTLEIKIDESDWMSPGSAINGCIWPSSNCDISLTYPHDQSYPTVPVYIRLRRNNPNIYSPIPANTEIASIRVKAMSRYWNETNIGYLLYKFNGDVTPATPTCDIKNFDRNVQLPDLPGRELRRLGVGAYKALGKEFTIDTKCQNATKVKVKFNGDKMPGVSGGYDVLANKNSGNGNVGILLAFNDKEMKFNQYIESRSETMKFKAWYYYKGGAFKPGPVRAQAVFTLAYE